jgi:hypothetical protein
MAPLLNLKIFQRDEGSSVDTGIAKDNHRNVTARRLSLYLRKRPIERLQIPEDIPNATDTAKLSR